MNDGTSVATNSAYIKCWMPKTIHGIAKSIWKILLYLFIIHLRTRLFDGVFLFAQNIIESEKPLTNRLIAMLLMTICERAAFALKSSSKKDVLNLKTAT